MLNYIYKLWYTLADFFPNWDISLGYFSIYYSPRKDQGAAKLRWAGGGGGGKIIVFVHRGSDWVWRSSVECSIA
jgi:hypothetical protein